MPSRMTMYALFVLALWIGSSTLACAEQLKPASEPSATQATAVPSKSKVLPSQVDSEIERLKSLIAKFRGYADVVFPIRRPGCEPTKEDRRAAFLEAKKVAKSIHSLASSLESKNVEKTEDQKTLIWKAMLGLEGFPYQMIYESVTKDTRRFPKYKIEGPLISPHTEVKEFLDGDRPLKGVDSSPARVRHF